MSSKKILKIVLLCFGLSLFAEAYAVTSTANESTLTSGFNDSEHYTSWSADHVTFKLSCETSAIFKELGHIYISNGDHLALNGPGRTFKLSWNVESSYDIVVTKVTLDVDRATVGGTITVGDGTSSGNLFWGGAKISTGSHEYSTDEYISITFSSTSGRSHVVLNSVTITYTIIPKFIFDGSGDGSDGDAEHLRWSKSDNWVHNNVPSINDVVYIRHNVEIEDAVAAKQMIIEGTNTVTVSPSGDLKIGIGGITGATTDNLRLQASTAGPNKGKTGSLRIDPAYAGALPSATVEMYSIAYFDMTADERNNAGSYQYVGSPMMGGAAAKSVFEKSWCYNWDETAGAWKNNRKNLILQPFVGYATSQYISDAGLLISHVGQLASNSAIVIPLTYNGSGAEAGANVLANSYAAPIDITKMQVSDFVNADATIYLFNTGSKNDAADGTTDAGQYVSIPVGLGSYLGYPTIIPSMQGFYVQANTPGVNGSLTLNYERMVWNTMSGNTALRAPQQVKETDKNSLCIALRADGWGDRLFIIESEDYTADFENGYDARKMMSGNLNIYAIEGIDSLAVDATNSLVGTRVGVRTGEETAYTLIFNRVNSEQKLTLLDEETSETIDISEGTEYTFYAEPNSVLDQRFRIIARSKAITTGLDKTESDSKVHKFIKGNQLYILRNGVLYNVMGTIVQQ